MNLLDKPNFFKNFKNNTLTILGLIFGIIPSFIPLISSIKIFNIGLNWVILFATIILVFFYCMWKYIQDTNIIYKEYRNLFNLFIKIQQQKENIFKDNERIKQDCNRLLNEKKEIMDVILILIEDVRRGTLTVNEYEKDYLLNLYNSFDAKLNNLKKRLGEK